MGIIMGVIMGIIMGVAIGLIESIHLRANGAELRPGCGIRVPERRVGRHVLGQYLFALRERLAEARDGPAQLVDLCGAQGNDGRPHDCVCANCACICRS